MRARWRDLDDWSRTIGAVLTVLDAVVVLVVVLALAADHRPRDLASSLAVLAAALLVAGATGLHRARPSGSVRADLPGLVLVVVVAVLVDTLVGPSPHHPMRHALAVAVMIAVLLVVTRTAAYAVVRLRRAAGRGLRRTLVVGTGPSARALAAALVARREHGLLPLGFLACDAAGVRGLPLPLLGDVISLAHQIEEERAEVVAFALAAAPDPTTRAVLDEALDGPATVMLVSAHLTALVAARGAPGEVVGDQLLVPLHRAPLTLPTRCLRRWIAPLLAPRPPSAGAPGADEPQVDAGQLTG